MEGFRPVGAFEPYKEAYFAWLAAKGIVLPETREDIWLPRDATVPGATAASSSIPAALSDTAWFTERALTYLKGAVRRPWFLHLGYYRPHPPFIAPEPYNRMYDAAAMPAPVRAASPADEAEQHPLLRYYVEHVKQANFFQNGEGLGSAMSEAEIRQMRAAYYGLMSEVDDHLARVFAFLDETDQWKDTLIVFTCDHGEQLGDHHLLGKIGYFDESFRIPMVLRDPSSEADAARGRIIDAFSETIDTMPTILDWLGGEIPSQCDGRSLLGFARDGAAPADWRREVHYEYDFRNVQGGAAEERLGLPMDDCSLAVIQDERYKYVHFAALPPLFFDLANDPHQFHNRAEDPAYAPLVRDYAQKMLSWRLRSADRSLTGYRASPNGLENRR
jgi:arylsulfatase A-like enzyme